MYMNQIINIDLNKHIDQSEDSNNKYTIPSKKHSYKKIFNIQFFLSIIAIFIITSVFTYYKISLNHKEDFSNLLINNYSITKLYSDNTDNSTQLESNSIIGIINKKAFLFFILFFLFNIYPIIPFAIRINIIIEIPISFP